MCNSKDIIIPRPLVKKLRQIRQKNPNGCFVAAFATCLGVSYEEAFKLVHPTMPYDGEYYSYYSHGLDPFRAYEIAAKHLRMFREAKERKFRSFKTNAFVTVRWRFAPSLSHAVVWDHKRKRILDPGGTNAHSMSELESQIWKVHYFKRPIVQASPTATATTTETTVAPSVTHEHLLDRI
jgi:hypothetical protein